MKYQWSLFLILFSFVMTAQDEHFASRIAYHNSNDDIIYAYIQPTRSQKVKVNDKATYYYFHQSKISGTQGGYAGYLLHGKSESFDSNDQLIEKGSYKHGLKHNEWKEWYPTGRLKKITHWKKGFLHGKETTFDESGNHLLTVKYKNGKLKKSFLPFKLKRKSKIERLEKREQRKGKRENRKEQREQKKNEKKLMKESTELE